MKLAIYESRNSCYDEEVKKNGGRETYFTSKETPFLNVKHAFSI